MTFESVEHSDMAVKMLNGRIVGGRVIVATLWDGKEKFKMAETEEERQRRMQSWEDYLGHEEDDEEEDADEPAESSNGSAGRAGKHEDSSNDEPRRLLEAGGDS